MPGKPAARLTDPTAHGGMISGPGVPTVLIGKMPAATLGDMHVCPMVTPGVPPIPHVGGPITLGSTGVLIGKKPAARMGDLAVCVGPPSSVIMGCPTVMIGEVGSGSQAGSAGSAAAAKAASLSGPKAVNPVKLEKKDPPKEEELASIQVQTLDSAGRPIGGLDFQLEDPDGKSHLLTTQADGSFTRGGFKKGKSFKVKLCQITDVKFDQTELEAGKAVQVSAKMVGFPANSRAVFRLKVHTIEQGEYDLLVKEVGFQGESAKWSWTYRPEQLQEVQAKPTQGDTTIVVEVSCGFHAAVTTKACLLKPVEKKPVKVTALHSA